MNLSTKKSLAFRRISPPPIKPRPRHAPKPEERKTPKRAPSNFRLSVSAAVLAGLSLLAVGGKAVSTHLIPDTYTATWPEEIESATDMGLADIALAQDVASSSDMERAVDWALVPRQDSIVG